MIEDYNARISALEQRVVDAERKYSELRADLDRHLNLSKREEGASIMSYDLSIRAKHVLEAANIWTFEELINYGSSRLLRQRNCGLRTIDELREALVKAGYTSAW